MRERPIIFSGPMVRAILDGSKTQTRRVVKPQPSNEWAPIVEHYCPTKIARNGDEYPGAVVFGAADENEGRPCPYGEPGDRLWVREAWAICHDDHENVTEESAMSDARDAMPWCSIVYSADANGGYAGEHLVGNRARPSIHMPRWASRLTLEVVSVRVERVQEISEEDATAEGFAAKPAQQWWQGYRRAEWIHPEALIHQDVEGDMPPDWMIEPKRVFATGGNHILYPTATRQFQDTWNYINGKKPGRSWADNPWVWVIEFKRIERGDGIGGAK